MMTLFSWWNIIFALPLAAGLILSLTIAFSGLGIDIGDAGDADADADVSNADFVDGDADIGDVGESDFVDTHLAHADIDHMGDSADTADAAAVKNVPFSYQVLGFFGIGKGVPLTVMIPLLFVIWGAGGLVLNPIFESLLRTPGLFAPLSMAASFFITAYAGQGLALGLRRLLGVGETAISSQGLLGLSGEAVYPINQEGGVAHVKDPYGNIHRILCKTSGTTIKAHQKVEVVAYDASKKHYVVEPQVLEEGV